MKLIGVNRQAQNAEQHYTPEELQLIVQESGELGALRSESSEMLQELFEFGDLTAGQVMVPRVRILGIQVGMTPGPSASSSRIKRIRATRSTRRISITSSAWCTSRTCCGCSFTTRPSPPRTRGAGRAGDGGARHRAHGDARDRTQMAVVIDEHGGTAGVVTLEDLFEEVVGDIEEGRRPQVYRDREGRLRVPGTMRLDEVGRHFDLDLEHEEVDSVSGLILTLLGGRRWSATASSGNGCSSR